MFAIRNVLMGQEQCEYLVFENVEQRYQRFILARWIYFIRFFITKRFKNCQCHLTLIFNLVQKFQNCGFKVFLQWLQMEKIRIKTVGMYTFSTTYYNNCKWVQISRDRIPNNSDNHAMLRGWFNIKHLVLRYRVANMSLYISFWMKL